MKTMKIIIDGKETKTFNVKDKNIDILLKIILVFSEPIKK